MKKHLFWVWAPLVLVCGIAQANDGFEAVKCGADVPKALVSKRMSDEPFVKTQARHTDLGLKNLGGDELSDSLNSSSLVICGSEYMLVLGAHGVVKDVLAIPPHSKTSPVAGAALDCQVNGKEVASLIVAILDNPAAAAGPTHYTAQDMTQLPAKTAWKIDEKTGKFSAFPTDGLTCPRSEIITDDAGP